MPEPLFQTIDNRSPASNLRCGSIAEGGWLVKENEEGSGDGKRKKVFRLLMDGGREVEPESRRIEKEGRCEERLKYQSPQLCY